MNKTFSLLTLGLTLYAIPSFAAKYRCSEVAAHSSSLEFKSNGVQYTTQGNSGSDKGLQTLLKSVGIPASISSGLGDVGFVVSFTNSECKKKANSPVEMTCTAEEKDMKLKVRVYKHSEENYEVYDLDTTDMTFKVSQTEKEGYPFVAFTLNFTSEGKTFKVAQTYHMYPVEMGHKATCKLQ